MTPLLWIVLSGVLFGSQFIPQKYCPAFPTGAYNVSMALGIAITGGIFFSVAQGPAPTLPLFSLVATGGLCWVIGNYLLIFAVRRAGMARPFCIINLTSVLSFIGGGWLLGELGEVSMARLALMALGVALVVAGSALISLISEDRGEISVAGVTGVGGGGTMRTGGERRGIAAAFVAPFFFAVFNVVIAQAINRAGVAPGPAFISFSPGIIIGALALALLPEGGESHWSPSVTEPGILAWRRAPLRWHGLALSQGIIWGTAMVCVMIGWLGTGLAIGVPVGQGVITLVSALWGLLVFKELERLKDRRRSGLQFLAGAALTVSGIAFIVLA
ncbi:MAG: GRP family sugar transporter [Thermoplasmata archaeon]